MNPSSPKASLRGATMVEVLVAALLIFLSLGSILAMNARSIRILKSTRQAIASSQMLQQRIESIRAKPWPEMASAPALESLMRKRLESEIELADPDSIEIITMSVPSAFGGEVAGARAFSVQRSSGRVTVLENADLTDERMLLVTATLQWKGAAGTQHRMVRTILCRNGLTRNGVFGSLLGRPGSGTSSPSTP
jgi:Tfp pilus assembly protein PilV